MVPELTYFVKVNLAFVILYGFYRLFFYKDTYFKLRRFVLLSFFVLAFSYPFFDMQEWVRAQEPIVEVIYTYSAMLPEVVVGEAESASWSQIITKGIFGLYLAVVCALLVRFLIQLASILRLARQSRRTVINDIPVYQLADPASPFSFFRMIFIYPSNHSEKELEEILTHECTHVSQWHSVDVVLTELITVFCWVNPFVWLLKREIRHNLEYLADNTVIHAGYDSKAYQFHLLGLTHYQATASIYNNFNILDIKNRIIMMNKKRSGKMGKTKYLIFIPIAILLVLLSNMDEVARFMKGLTTGGTTAGKELVTLKGTVVDAQGQPIIGAAIAEKGGNTGTVTDLQGNYVLEVGGDATLAVSFTGYKTVEQSVKGFQQNPKITMSSMRGERAGDQIFTVVEEMPKFPGGDAALMAFISKNIVYPIKAIEEGAQGRVIVTFVVEKDGSISSAEVVRGVEETLDTEALRVIGLFPKWEPGKQRGNAVAVKYTVPVTFRINGDTKVSDVYTIVDEMPKFPGGDAALMNFLAKAIKYPTDAQESGIQGRVIASFTVKKDGSISDAEIVRGVSPSLDEESLRVLATMPKWSPGKEDGKPVNVKYTVPITFRLQ